jgi:hypothetical protein
LSSQAQGRRRAIGIFGRILPPLTRLLGATLMLARRLFPETENTIITEEVKKLPDGK